MQVSRSEGLATRTGPESCAAARKDGGEALTGEGAGRVFSREMSTPPPERRLLRGADAVRRGGRPHPARRQRETRQDPARSETPRMLGSTLHGNREIPRPPVATGGAGRIGKSKDVRR
jgi:hypothetical protein